MVIPMQQNIDSGQKCGQPRESPSAVLPVDSLELPTLMGFGSLSRNTVKTEFLLQPGLQENDRRLREMLLLR